MSDYWKNFFDQSAMQYFSDPFKQVGKTVRGVTVETEQLNIIIEQVTSALKLTSNSFLVDLGCGNGLLTKKIAPYVSHANGFDFSENLIEFARTPPVPKNTCFFCRNITKICPTSIQPCSDILMYEVIQHLSEVEVEFLLQNLKKITDTKIFIGGIPDREHIFDFYDTPGKREFYEKSLRERKPHLGTWFCKAQLSDLASKNGWNIEYINQNPKLYTSYYRFDAILTQAN